MIGLGCLVAPAWGGCMATRAPRSLGGRPTPMPRRRSSPRRWPSIRRWPGGGRGSRGSWLTCVDSLPAACRRGERGGPGGSLRESAHGSRTSRDHRGDPMIPTCTDSDPGSARVGLSSRRIATTIKRVPPARPNSLLFSHSPPPAKPLDGSRSSISWLGTGNSARGAGTPSSSSEREKALVRETH